MVKFYPFCENGEVKYTCRDSTSRATSWMELRESASKSSFMVTSLHKRATAKRGAAKRGCLIEVRHPQFVSPYQCNYVYVKPRKI